MDEPTDHTQCSKSERERQICYDLMYMWSLKYERNELIYEPDSQTQRTDLWFPRWRVLEMGGLGVGVSIRKQLHIEWINTIVLLLSTESYIQCPIWTMMEKNLLKNINSLLSVTRSWET